MRSGLLKAIDLARKARKKLVATYKTNDVIVEIRVNGILVGGSWLKADK